MPRRYPKYQEGGQVPSDIRRLLSRLMEGRASGGVIGFQGGGMPPKKPKKRLLANQLSREQLRELFYHPRLRQDIPMEDHPQITEDMLPGIEEQFDRLQGELGGGAVPRPEYGGFAIPRPEWGGGGGAVPRPEWQGEIDPSSVEENFRRLQGELGGGAIPRPEYGGERSSIEENFRRLQGELGGVTPRIPPQVTPGMLKELERSNLLRGNASGGIIGLQDGGGVMEALRNIPRGMLDVPRRAIEGIRERIPEGIRDRISEYAEENPPMGSPGWSPRWGPSRFGEGSLDPDRAMDSDQLRERQKEILDTLGNIPRGIFGTLKRAGERAGEGLRDFMEEHPRREGLNNSWIGRMSQMGRHADRMLDSRRASGGIIGLQGGGLLRKLSNMLRGGRDQERLGQNLTAGTDATTRHMIENKDSWVDDWFTGMPLVPRGLDESGRNLYIRDMMSGQTTDEDIDKILNKSHDFYQQGMSKEDIRDLVRESRERDFGQRRGRGGNASGGIISLQDGGVIGFQAGGNPYQQRMVQSYVSPEVAQPYADLTGRIQQAGAQPYTPYGGQRLAATTGDQALARSAYGAYGRGAGPAGTQQAAGTMGQAGQMLGGAYQGMAGLQPQYAQMAGQFGQAAQGALGQAQQDATALRGAAGTAQRRGDLAAAGMRQTGAAAQAQQQQLGAQQEARGRIAQTQMQGLGQQMGAAGQQALGAQQQFGAGQQALGAGAAGQAQGREAQAAALGQQAQQAGAAGQAQMGQMGTQAQQLGQTAMGQMGQTGQAAQQAGQIGAADIRQAGIEGQQLGEKALGQMGQVGQQSQQQAQQAAERMRQIGGQAPQLQKGADMSDYMSQYTKGVTDPQLQQLMEFQKMQGQELGSQAAGAGAFGGSRQGVQAAEQAKAASQQAAEIIGSGQQKAFESAQQAFQADRAAQQQAQQTGLSAEGQAAQTQAGAQGQALQAQQAGFGAAQQGQAGRQAAAQAATQAQQQGLSAQLQAQQAGVGAAQAGGAQQLQAAQQGMAAGQQGRDAQMRAMQTGIAAGQYGSDAQMRAGQQAAAMGQAGAGALQQALAGQGALTAQGIGMGQQGLAAQRAAATQGAQLGLQGQQQGFQAGQAGAQLGMTGLGQAGQLGQQGYGTMGRMLGQQQGAIGAQGQAFGQMGQMGAQMGQLGGQQMQLGQQQQQQQMQRLQAMEQAGARTQQEQQRDYDIAYQDFQKQQQWPQQQIGWQLGAMQQLPYQNTQVIGDYQQAPSTASDITGAAGAYQKYQSDQAAAGTGEPASTIGQTDPYGNPLNPEAGQETDAYTDVYGETEEEPGFEEKYGATGTGAHGGYLSSSGILAPYHKKLIDGLYAGGRINY